MALENFLEYIEIDPNNHITVAKNHLDFEAYASEFACLNRDRGSGHFKNFEHLIAVRLVSAAPPTPGVGAFWALQNEVNDMYALQLDGKTLLSCRLHSSAGVLRLWLVETYGGSLYESAYIISLNTWYYLKIKKQGTTFTMEIYSDAARTNLLTTLTRTLHGDWDFQYIFPANTWDCGIPNVVEMDIDNLDLQELPPTPPPSPGPQPAGTGTINVYAVADADEVTASVQIIETKKQYNTPFSEYLTEETYTVRASYESQTLTWNPTVTAGGTYEKIFRFTKIHPVTITSEPTPIDFTLNGEKQSTPFSQPLVSGAYTVVFPASWMVGVDTYIFTQWENGSVNPSRTMTLGSPEAELVATYRLKQIDEAGPINQRQHKDNLRQVFGDEKDLSSENPLPVNVVGGGITADFKKDLQQVLGQDDDISPTNPLITEDLGTNTNPERWLHDNHWDNGVELVLNAAAAANLGVAVGAGVTRRVRSITVRNTALVNTVITLSQVAPAQNRVSFDVPAQTTRVWSEQDAVEFLAGVQVQIASSAAAAGAETYIHAAGVEA